MKQVRDGPKSSRVKYFIVLLLFQFFPLLSKAECIESLEVAGPFRL